MGGHRVGELRRLVDLRQRDQNLGRHLLVELHILLELGHHRAHQRLGLAHLALGLGQDLGLDLEEARVVDEALDPGAGIALDQHLDRAVGQLEQLQDAGNRPDAIDVLAAGIVLARILLRHQQDLLVVLHHLLERVDRLLAPDEQRDDHVGEDDDVAQRQHRKQRILRMLGHLPSPCRTSLPQRSHGLIRPPIQLARTRPVSSAAPRHQVPQRPVRMPRHLCGRRRS